MGVKEYENNLKGEYLEAYKNTIDAIKVENFEFEFEEEIKNDILELLLSAQEDGVEVSKVIGSDTRKFCLEVSKQYKKSTSISFKIYRSIVFLLGLVSGAFIARMFTRASIDVDISYSFVFLVITIVCAQLIGKNITRKVKIFKNRSKDKIIIELGVIILSTFIFTSVEESINVTTWVSINGMVAVTIICAIMVVLALIFESKKVNS